MEHFTSQKTLRHRPEYRHLVRQYNDTGTLLMRFEVGVQGRVAVKSECLRAREKERPLSCEKILPLYAWMVLGKSGPFFAQACKMLEKRTRIMYEYTCM